MVFSKLDKMIKRTNKSKKAEESDAGGDDFVLVDDDETPDSETCTWEECIACIKVSFTSNSSSGPNFDKIKRLEKLDFKVFLLKFGRKSEFFQKTNHKNFRIDIL